MKHPEDCWENQPPFEEEHPEDTPGMNAIRRIELIGRLHRTVFRSILRDDELQPAQAGAIRDIIREPGMSQRELADRLHIQRATATVMLQKMERSGFIERRPDLTDQRISRIYPTEKARSIDAENRKNVAAYFDRCFSGVEQEDFAVAVEVLGKLWGNLRQIQDEHPEFPGKE